LLPAPFEEELMQTRSAARVGARSGPIGCRSPAASPRAKRARAAHPHLSTPPAADAPIICALSGDALRTMALCVDEEDLPCFRAVCVAFRDHAPRALSKQRSWLLRNPSLASLAWDETERLCALAASQGSAAVLRFLRDKGCAWDVRTTCAAARHGHLDALRWAHKQGCPWTAGTCYAAARGGHLAVLQWAIEHGCPCDLFSCKVVALTNALRHGSSLLEGAPARAVVDWIQLRLGLPPLPWHGGAQVLAMAAIHEQAPEVGPAQLLGFI
jgi:hypothetical protein